MLGFNLAHNLFQSTMAGKAWWLWCERLVTVRRQREVKAGAQLSTSVLFSPEPHPPGGNRQHVIAREKVDFIPQLRQYPHDMHPELCLLGDFKSEEIS